VFGRALSDFDFDSPWELILPGSDSLLLPNS
jgi:hypothetical protein